MFSAFISPTSGHSLRTHAQSGSLILREHFNANPQPLSRWFSFMRTDTIFGKKSNSVRSVEAAQFVAWDHDNPDWTLINKLQDLCFGTFSHIIPLRPSTIVNLDIGCVNNMRCDTGNGVVHIEIV